MSKRAALKALQDVPGQPTEDDRTVGGDESVSEALSKQVFTAFKSSSSAIDRGLPHPGETAVEATSLGALCHCPSQSVWHAEQDTSVCTAYANRLEQTDLLHHASCLPRVLHTKGFET